MSEAEVEVEDAGSEPLDTEALRQAKDFELEGDEDFRSLWRSAGEDLFAAADRIDYLEAVVAQTQEKLYGNVRVIEVKPSADGQFYFTGQAGNGEVVVTSELYTRKEDAERGARAVFPYVYR